MGTQQKDGIYELQRGHSPAPRSTSGFVLDPSIQNGEKHNPVVYKPPSLRNFVLAAWAKTGPLPRVAFASYGHSGSKAKLAVTLTHLQRETNLDIFHFGNRLVLNYL